jgi:hypothetical protein
MLAPRWWQVKIGPLLRGERDPRLYHDLFLPRVAGQLAGPRAALIRLTARRIDEPANWRTPPVDSPVRQLVVFTGEGRHFQPLAGQHTTLRHEIRAMTRPRWLRAADAVTPGAIGVHVRRSDFVEARDDAEFSRRGAVRTPITWFAACLSWIRKVAGVPLPVLMVSELRPVLSLPDVRFVRTGSAIGDLLVLSRTQLLLASTGSTFSLWAAFLGQMPTIAYPTPADDWFGLQATEGQFVGTWGPDLVPAPQLTRQVEQLGAGWDNRSAGGDHAHASGPGR